MNTSSLGIGAVALLMLCSSADAPPQSVVLAEYGLGAEEPTTQRLNRRLAEISGLAVTEDGRTFAHNDERARVFELDPNTGEPVKSFDVGDRLRGDFEGIAIAGDRFFLMTSTGTLVEFTEAVDGGTVSGTTHELGLDGVCEFEGLAHDARTNALLLACKTIRRRGERAILVISVPLATMRPDSTPRVLVEEPEAEAAGIGGQLRASGIALHPVTGNYVLISAIDNLIVEVSRDGAVLGARRLRSSIHPQAEGVAFLPDRTLLIADEGGNGSGRITAYRVADSP